MSARRFLIVFSTILFSGLGGVIAFNAWMDPLWLFDHQHAFNRRQTGFDERQQKINRLLFGAPRFDALLLGSSRATYIDQHDFPGYEVFNLAASGMRPHEYGGYIDVAERTSGKPTSTVFLAIDFFATNRNYRGGEQSPETYFASAREPLYRLKNLVSADLFEKSLANFRARQAECDCYDRANVKHMAMPAGEQKVRNLHHDLDVFREHVYGSGYSYDEGLKEVWHQLRTRYPNTRFVVFTTPTAEPLFRLMVQTGHLADYERWLTDAVEEFGQVRDFMGISSITSNLDNYQDGGHFTPAVGRIIAGKVVGEAPLPEDFGTVVTRDNIAHHLAKIRRALSAESSATRATVRP